MGRPSAGEGHSKNEMGEGLTAIGVRLYGESRESRTDADITYCFFAHVLVRMIKMMAIRTNAAVAFSIRKTSLPMMKRLPQ